MHKETDEDTILTRQAEQLSKICIDLFPDDWRKIVPSNIHEHPIWHVGHRSGLRLDSLKETLTSRLESIRCQLITLDLIADDENDLSFFTVAPVLFERVTTVYHATPISRISSIMAEGLLPSNSVRKLTDFVNTEGKIHASRLLKKQSELGDPAAWWQNYLSDKMSESFGVIEIDLSELPDGSRVYRDVHSMWGLVIDRLDKIPPAKLREVQPKELISITL